VSNGANYKVTSTGSKHKVITIDGLSGSGKSTVARKLAKQLGFIHLNSGALYRVVGLEVMNRGLALDDDASCSVVAKALKFEFQIDSSGVTQLFVDGRRVGEELSKPNAAEFASKVAMLAGVRDALGKVQREAARSNSLVLEGRDAGTVIFPNAEFKFYLDASIDVRASRRFEEFADRSTKSLEEVKEELKLRDNRDSTRQIAPHRKPDNAFVIDTTNITVEQVVEKILELVNGEYQKQL
jgi:CMP/dCMP kinase